MSYNVLALSGGGFRASLFHLGVIRYLRNKERLSSLDSIVGVSGGSIVAAHLVLNWEQYTHEDEEIVDKCFKNIIEFIKKDIRGKIIRRTIFRRDKRINILVSELNKLYENKRLGDIGENAPDVLLLSTNMIDGTRTVFSRKKYTILSDENVINDIETDSITVGSAVAASAAFPAVFSPVIITNRDLGVDQRILGNAKHYLSDGGIIDNSGIDIINSLLMNENIEEVLISDAGRPFDINQESYSGLFGVLKTSLRSTDIMMEEIATYAKQSLKNNKTTIISIGHRDDKSSNNTLSLKAQNLLKYIRTDLDEFSNIEINSLIVHGQNAACEVLNDDKDGYIPWEPEKTDVNVEEIESHLEKSSRRKLRLVSSKDRIGTSVIITVLSMILVVPVLTYRYYSSRYTFKAHPFSFSLNYPENIHSVYAGCFESYVYLDKKECDEFKNRIKKHVDENNKILKKFKNKIDADISDEKITNSIHRYCGFLEVEGDKGNGTGYILWDENQENNQIKVNQDKEALRKKYITKGFILFKFTNEPMIEHGLAFTTKRKNNELIIDVAQPPLHNRKGGLFRAKLPLNDKQQRYNNIRDILLTELTGNTIFEVSSNTSLPLKEDDDLDDKCKVDGKPGVMEFSKIKINTR